MNIFIPSPKDRRVLFFLFIFSLLLDTNCLGQVWKWSVGFGNLSAESGKKINVDPKGYMYVTVTDINPGYTVSCPNGIGFNALLKYDSIGNLLWSRPVPGVAKSASVDKYGNSFITGGFMDSASFCGLISDTTVYANPGNYDAFLAKYNTTGELKWVRTLADTFTDDFGMAVKNDSLGNVVLAGEFSRYYNSKNIHQDFLSKYDSSGTLIWHRNSNWRGQVFPKTLDVSGTGEIYVSGDFRDTAFFDKFIFVHPMGFVGSSIFLAKFNSNGHVLWAKKTGNNTSPLHETTSLLLTQKGSFYITGRCTSPANFDNITITTNTNLPCMFVAHYDTSGSVNWVKNTNVGWGRSVAADSSGDCIVTGGFPGKIIFPHGNSADTLVSVRKQGDMFVAKYNKNGVLVWTLKPGGSNDGYATEGLSNCFDLNKNRCYFTGYTNETTIFGFNSTYAPTSTHGSSDVFVARMDFTTSGPGSNLSLSDVKLNSLTLHLYPNPAHKSVTVDLTKFVGPGHTIRLEVYDATGKQIESYEEKKKEMQLDFENKPPGIYLITVQTNSGTRISKKIIKD